MENHKTGLTSAEMAGLWGQYMTDSATSCVLSYLIKNIEDNDIRSIVEEGLRLAEGNLLFQTNLLREESFPVPVGFNKEDVNLDAPRLFSDIYCLYYLKYLSIAQMTASTLAIGLSTRSDVVNFHEKILMEAVKLQETIKRVLLEKGVFIRPPYIPMPDEVEFVTDQGFLGTLVGNQRPLTTIEISHLYVNIESSVVGKEMMMAFAQVAEDKKVRQYFKRGKETINKHLKQLTTVILKDDLTAPMPWDASVTDSKEAPFSDKLMMFMVTALSAAGIAKYGVAMGASPRKDIGLKYALLLGETTLFAEDGANLMIDNGWLEEPPQAPGHQKDAKA